MVAELKQTIKPKPIHMAKGLRDDGAVTALCFTRPRPINLKAATWTNRLSAVTCEKCLRSLHADSSTHIKQNDHG
jgi:hypothetical protein